MLRLFSTFPAGAPGVALLLLRFALAISIFDHGRDCLAPRTPPFLCVVFAVFAGLLCLGLLTPIVSYLACLAVLWNFVRAGYGDWQFELLFGLTVIALALLGPGAYSMDARRFGRRLIVFPPGDTSQSFGVSKNPPK